MSSANYYIKQLQICNEIMAKEHISFDMAKKVYLWTKEVLDDHPAKKVMMWADFCDWSNKMYQLHMKAFCLYSKEFNVMDGISRWNKDYPYEQRIDALTMENENGMSYVQWMRRARRRH